MAKGWVLQKINLAVPSLNSEHLLTKANPPTSSLMMPDSTKAARTLSSKDRLNLGRQNPFPLKHCH